MDAENIIRGKRILIVDDEEDVLDTLIEHLDVCRIDTATTFEKGKELLESRAYDVAVLDIMGVKGYDLLDIAMKRDIPALMLTAHALTEDNLKRSAENGASYFVPKDEMHQIQLFVADVVKARDKRKNAWVKWFERLGGFYDRRFGGPDWREKEREFWEKKLKDFPPF